MGPSGRTLTPDQRLRVFVSSTLMELRDARSAARRAIEQLHLSPVMLDLAARPHPQREQYGVYLAQSDVFIGIYWQSYGWVADGAEISGVEDELRLAAGMPRLLYVREPAPERDPRLETMLDDVRAEAATSYQHFADSEELEAFILDDLAVLLSERFEMHADAPPEAETPARRRMVQPVNPLIGRAAEMARVRAWLESGHARLVTLTGPGGVGKSRLAQEVAQQVEAHFPDGIWTIPLEPISDASLVLPSVARALKVRTGVTDRLDEVLESLTARLGGRRVLLVLENFEHLLTAAADLAALLESCDGVHVLVTSRSALRIRAEHELPVPPLHVPPDPAQESLQQLQQSAAVQLFLARAQAVNRAFNVDEATLRAIAEICRRLDGLPLAIELAAARVRLLPPHQLLHRLERRFAVLTGGTSDMPERHQTLRATIDWGYDLLEPSEQVALQRLSVFSGGWTLAAAEELLTTPGSLEADILDVLDGLVTKSFVTPITARGPAPRFGMLETIRAYARERLAIGKELDATVAAHAEYFLRLAEHAAPQLNGPDQTTWFAAMEEDHDNLLTALGHFVVHSDRELELRLTVALGRLWLVHSHVALATRWLGRSLGYSTARRDRLRADLLTWAGWMALFVQGDADAAETISHEALGIRRELEDRHGEAVEILALGNVAVFRGDAVEAQRRYRETATVAQANGDEEMGRTRAGESGRRRASAGRPGGGRRIVAPGVPAHAGPR